MNRTLKKNLTIIAVSAAVLVLVAVVWFAVASRTNLRVEADTEYYIPEVKDGRYYLNGDVQSGVYVLIDNGMVTLCGDDESIEKLVYEVAADNADGGVPSEGGLQQARELVGYDTKTHDFCVTPKIGHISKGDAEYDFLDWDCDFYGLLNDHTEPDEDGFAGGTGFWFDGNDRLTRYCFEFVYVENT